MSDKILDAAEELLGADKPEGPTWKNRRRYLLVLTAFSMKLILYITWHELDTETSRTIINMAFWSLIIYFGTYVGGSTWQDISLNNFGRK